MEKRVDFILQKDAALLRECLSYIYKFCPPEFKIKIVETLNKYANNIKGYCKHPSRVLVKKDNMKICLDCGDKIPNLEL